MSRDPLRAAVAAPTAEQAAIALLLAMGYRNVAAPGSALMALGTDAFMDAEDIARARRLSYGGTGDE